jgi:hypothetical protein
MMFREAIAVYSENHMKPTNTLYQKLRASNDMAGWTTEGQ